MPKKIIRYPPSTLYGEFISGIVDEKDHKITKILRKNAHVTNTEVAERLGISEATVRNRTKKLVSNRVIQNIEVINPETLENDFHSHIGTQVDYQKLILSIFLCEIVCCQSSEKGQVFSDIPYGL